MKRSPIRRKAPYRARVAIKREVARRDNGTCQRCARRGHHVHHKLPRGRGGTDSHENLVLLCHPCHRWVHDNPAAAVEQGWTLEGYHIEEGG